MGCRLPLIVYLTQRSAEIAIRYPAVHAATDVQLHPTVISESADIPPGSTNASRTQRTDGAHVEHVVYSDDYREELLYLQVFLMQIDRRETRLFARYRVWLSSPR
jgi:hypothetical protein